MSIYLTHTYLTFGDLCLPYSTGWCCCESIDSSACTLRICHFRTAAAWWSWSSWHNNQIEVACGRMWAVGVGERMLIASKMTKESATIYKEQQDYIQIKDILWGLSLRPKLYFSLEITKHEWRKLSKMTTQNTSARHLQTCCWVNMQKKMTWNKYPNIILHAS